MKQVICKSGLKGWQCRLRSSYKKFEVFEEYDRIYKIAERLGFVSARVAWELNPIIQGSADPSDLKTVGFRTLDKIVWPVECKYGAPMGRFSNELSQKPKDQKIFDSAIRMSPCGAYDFGGAYWGCGKQLRVEYTKDLKYVRFYRRGEK